MRAAWDKMRENYCRDSFKADAKSNFFPPTCCSTHKKYNKREPGLFKEEFRCAEMLCLCSKTYSCYDNKTDKIKFSSKRFNKRVLEDSSEGPMSHYRLVLDEEINLTSTNRGFRTINHMVATCEQTKKDLVIFIQKDKFKMMEFIQNHWNYKKWSELVKLFMMSYYIGFMILKRKILR